MPAQFYCWDPALGLSPNDANFEETIDAFHAAPRPQPDPRMRSFVNTVVSRFTGLDDVLWATGPLEVDILGSFIDFAVSRSRYAEARPMLIETARAHGLNCYDLQDGQLYPATLH